MLIKDIFEVPIENDIDPVIKVGDRADDRKLASEIDSYVVTPNIERYLDNFLEHYTDSIRVSTDEIGVWISGYFGSGKSHLAKIASLLVENRTLDDVPAIKRFQARIPADAPLKDSIIRSLSRIDQCETEILAFNLNTLQDSKNTPLPRLLLSQYYISRGYSGNLLYARVIESEMDIRGKLDQLHTAVEAIAGKPWHELYQNLAFYSRALYQAAVETAPDAFPAIGDVQRALKSAESGELFNIRLLIKTILDNLHEKERKLGKPCRFVFVMDESGQWIEDDEGKLATLTALVEEAAQEGKGKIWVLVTTHEDMPSIYQNARALRADMKKAEGRFRHKFSLTTENIELVLEDRIFKKTRAGKDEVIAAYKRNSGSLRDLGELKNTAQQLPECTPDRFPIFYPFFPYQIHLIPEIVKSLRSSGGRGEQLSGSTRTLLAISQDIIRFGRRKYLEKPVGAVISFDEVYQNLAGEAEVSPDIRKDMKRIEELVKGATGLTRRVAEVLYLIHELSYIPRTLDNLTRLLVEHTDEQLSTVMERIKPELDKLINAKLVARIGEEFEYLTGERRTFEEEVEEDKPSKWQDLEAGMAEFATADVLGFSAVPFRGKEFPVHLYLDDVSVTRQGDVNVYMYAPLTGESIAELENRSLGPGEQNSIFVLSERIGGFDERLRYYLAMKRVIDRWKGDPNKSSDARTLASEKESQDLSKIRRRLTDEIHNGFKRAHLVFRGSSRMIYPKSGQSAGEAVKSELASYFPTLYPKYEKCPVRITNEQRAIIDVLKGAKKIDPDVQALKILTVTGQVNPQSPLLENIRIFLSARQEKSMRTLGKEILDEFSTPPYGWDPAAVRVGVAAMIRAGDISLLINKKAYTNPADADLQTALRVSNAFNKTEIVLEEAVIDIEMLTEVRSLLIKLTGNRKIDETSAALSESFESMAKELLEKADKAMYWAKAARFPLSESFTEAFEFFDKLFKLSHPNHRIKFLYDANGKIVEGYRNAIHDTDSFIRKWGTSYTEARVFTDSLTPVKYRLPQKSASVKFLTAFKDALAGKTLLDTQVWRDIEGLKVSATLELEKLSIECSEDARNTIQAAFAAVPENIDRSALPIDNLTELLDTIEQGGSGFEALSFPEQAGYRVKQLEEAVRREMDKERREGGKKSGKKRVPLKISEAAGIELIQNDNDIEVMQNNLKKAIKEKLDNGYEVEIS